MIGSGEQFLQLRSEESELQQGISFEHLIDAKKSNIANAVSTIAKEVSEGNYDSLKGLVLALKGKALFTDLEAALRPLANDAYLNRLEKGYSIHDVDVAQGATKTEYDYSVCKDPEWVELFSKSELAKLNLKERETFLKALKKPLELVDTETGETYTIYPPNKLQTEGLKISIR